MQPIPLVSVLMTAYNREKYIAEAIESVLASTYTNFELIIVDDCSIDHTLEIAKSYEDIESRIKVFSNLSNIGQFQNRNLAARYAKGKYIKYLDSDDIIYSYGLHTMVEAMEKFPNTGIGFANYWNRYRNRMPIGISSEEAYRMHYFGGGLLYVGPSGSIYNREFFNSIGGFNPNYSVSADFEFNLKAAQNAPIVCFQNDLFWWRSHGDQEYNKRQNEYEQLNNEINTYYLKHNNCPLSRGEAVLSINNLKNILARRVLLKVVKLNFRCAIIKTKQLKISFSQLLFCILPSSMRRKLQILLK